MAGRKSDKSPTRVSIYGVRDVRLLAPDNDGMTVEFTVEQANDDTINDMLYAVCRHYGIDRHGELVRDLLRTPGYFDRVAGERLAQQIIKGD